MTAPASLPIRIASLVRTGPAASVDRRVSAALARPDVRIGLIGNFGSENLGNEGTLATLLQLLRDRRPHARFGCICTNPDRARSLHEIASIPIHDTAFASSAMRWTNRVLKRVPGRLADAVRALWHIRQFDVLIVPGTGILDDFGERPLGIPSNLLLWTAAARIMGRPFCFISIGAGPIHNRTSLKLMGTAARLASYRSYRDDISRDFAASIGIDTRRDIVTPDLVFAMPTPASTQASDEADRPLTVGIGVMSYDGWYSAADGASRIYDTYIGKISSFAIWLIERGHRVRLLVGESSDQRAVKDVYRRLHAHMPLLAEGQLVAEPADTLHTLMVQMLDTDCVVATRFHNVVCALKVTRPVISIGYARKNDALLADFGLDEFCQDIEHLDVPVLKQQFEALTADLDGHRQTIAARVDRYQQTLDAQLDALLGRS